MRLYIFILAGIFLFGIISFAPLASSPNSSSTDVDLIVPGCTVPGTNEGLIEGQCSSEKTYFCKREGTFVNLESTLDDLYACSYGNTSYGLDSDYVGPFCCPSGTRCDRVNHTCEQFDNVCDQFNNPLDRGGCRAANCFVVFDMCVPGVSGFACSNYSSQSTCLNDTWGLGQVGVGTSDCGRYFDIFDGGTIYSYIIPSSSCRCEWNGGCDLAWNSVPLNYGAVSDELACSKNFNTGLCIDGVQDFNWIAVSNFSGFINLTLSINQTLLAEASGCVDGSGSRSCGEEPVKLPFFSAFSLISSILLLGLFYFSRERRIKYRKGL